MTDAEADLVEQAADELAPDAEAMHRLERIVEALLLSADQPLSLEQIQRLLHPDFNAAKKDLRQALDLLAQRLAPGALELAEVASGFRVQVKGEYAEWVGRLWQEKPPRYSRALLETLALVCYRQPITRGEIEDVRGVSVSSNILRTLVERGWIREVGVKEVPGRPTLFGTTAQFLDDFSLKSLDQLPALPDIKDLEQLDAALARLAAVPPSQDTEEVDAGAPGPDSEAEPPDGATVH
jgi:segregation and condensation protein B